MQIPSTVIATAVLTVFPALWTGIPASAQNFGDCSEASYRKLFDPRIENTPYDCVERLRVKVSTEAGGRAIRLLHDRNGGWALASDTLAGFERGIRGAKSAMERIGPFRMNNVSVLLIDGLPPRERGSDDFSNIAAVAGASDGECRIAVYLLGPASDAANAAFVVAHEIFHCVQEATLSAAQMGTSSNGRGAGGDWWIEGSADWFAALALPGPGPLPDRIARFDDVSAETPLYEMAYEAVVFFLWLNDDRGPASVLPFLRQMASNAGAGAQHNVINIYESDGTFATAPLAAELTTVAETNRGDVRGDGQAVSQSSGRWSAEDGLLNLCQDQLHFQGTVKMTAPDGVTATMEVPEPIAPESVTMRYSCSETSLETTLTFPGIPEPMVTQYSRISMPGE